MLRLFKCALFIYILMCFDIAYADQATTQPGSAANQDNVSYTGELTYVNISDPFVIRVATFGAQAIQRGALYKILSGQVKGLKDWVYIFVIEVVDAHSIHHRYNVQVYVPSGDPKDDSKWKLVYFTAVNY